MTTTNSDLHRFVLEPWCPKCGWVDAPDDPPSELDQAIAHTCGVPKPGLWERFPDVRPPGLEYSIPGNEWAGVHGVLDPREVNLLILGGIAENAPTISFTYLKNGRKVAMVICPPDTPLHGQQFVGEADTLVEAACIALHRYGDSKEQQDG